MKYLEIRQEGYVWRVPLIKIAEIRAEHYADEGDVQGEIDWVMEDEYEAIDWYQNNMDFDEIEQFAELVAVPTPLIRPDPHRDSEIEVDTTEN